MVSIIWKTYLEPPDILSLEQAAARLCDWLLIRLLYRLGCRISEALGIEADNVDFAARTITILHLKTRIRMHCPFCQSRLSRNSTFCSRCGAKVEQSVKKALSNKRMRTLPIDDETLEMLKKHIDGGGCVIRDGKRLLFGIGRHRAWQIVKECAERAGLPKLINPETGKVHNVSPHRLRDAFAVHAVKLDDSGDGLRLLQEHLGHQSFNTTAKYRKVAGEEHRAWYERLWSDGSGTENDR